MKPSKLNLFAVYFVKGLFRTVAVGIVLTLAVMVFAYFFGPPEANHPFITTAFFAASVSVWSEMEGVRQGIESVRGVQGQGQ